MGRNRSQVENPYKVHRLIWIFTGTACIAINYANNNYNKYQTLAPFNILLLGPGISQSLVLEHVAVQIKNLNSTSDCKFTRVEWLTYYEPISDWHIPIHIILKLDPIITSQPQRVIDTQSTNRRRASTNTSSRNRQQGTGKNKISTRTIRIGHHEKENNKASEFKHNPNIYYGRN